ncbi:hypothetical protein HY732_04085 [Candidatus Uhrbacteria bacterium]|nr:hypothetical protein [Candidatus Uhrbacteria bacterium]
MIKKSQKGIWETDVQTINLSNPKVLKWYVERKIEAGDWGALDRTTLAPMLGKLSIDVRVKSLLRDFLSSHGHSHRQSPPHPRRAWKK